MHLLYNSTSFALKDQDFSLIRSSSLLNVYPLVICQFAVEDNPIDIESFPISMVI